MAAKIDLVIASAETGWRRQLVQGLRREAEFGRIHEVQSRAGLEAILARLAPPVLLLHWPLGGFQGLDGLRSLRAVSPATRTILVVDAPDDGAAVRALLEGIRGYCARTADPALLSRAIQLVHQGEIWIGRRVIVQLLEAFTALHRPRLPEASGRLGRLTSRERQLAELIAAGASNKEAAQDLSISEKTVKAHLTSIFQKLEISNRVQLAVYTLQAELGRPTPAPEGS